MVSQCSFLSKISKWGQISTLTLLSLLMAKCQTMPVPDGYGYINPEKYYFDENQKDMPIRPEKVLPGFSSFLSKSLSFTAEEPVDQRDLSARKNGLAHYANQMEKLHHDRWVTRLTEYAEAALPAVESYNDYQVVASGYTLNLASFFERELKNYQKIDSYESYMTFLSEIDALKHNKKILAEI